MKKRLFSFMVIAMMTIGAFAQVDLVKQFGNKNGVMGMNIGSEMLQLIPKEELAADNQELAFLFDKMEQLQILSCNSAETGNKLVTDVTALLKREGYKEILSPEDDGTKSTGFFKSTSAGSSSMVVIEREEAAVAIMMINGSFTWSDLTSVGIRYKE